MKKADDYTTFEPFKFALISDIHGNATALETVLEALAKEHITDIINLGDAIAIGPDPERVLGILVAKRIPSLCGNHEQYFLEGTKAFPEMDPNEKTHQDWIRQQLAEPYVPVVSEFPLQQVLYTHGRQLSFLHYAMLQNNLGQTRFMSPRPNQDLEGLKALFGDFAQAGGITCFGHNHQPCHVVDPQTGHHYINPGSLGCHPEALARYAVVVVDEYKIEVELRTIPYNKTQVLDRLFSREVPEREAILRNFYT